MRSGGFALHVVEHGIAKNPGEHEELIRIERERLEAIKQGNVKVLDRIYAPEYTAVFSRNPGHMVSKNQELMLQGPESRRLLSWEPKDITIRLYGHVGLVTGLATVQDVLLGKTRHLHSQYTHVWVKRDSGWQLVHRHVNRLATSLGPHFDNDARQHGSPSLEKRTAA